MRQRERERERERDKELERNKSILYVLCMLYVFFISFFRVSSVLLNRVKMLYPFPHTSTLRFFSPLLSSLLLLHTFIQTLWIFIQNGKRKRGYKHKSCVSKYWQTRRFFTSCFLADSSHRVRCRHLRSRQFLTPIQRAYVFLLFSYFYFIFECRNLFHLTLIDERAYILVPYIPCSCKKYDEEV